MTAMFTGAVVLERYIFWSAMALDIFASFSCVKIPD
jgi:hypothetical protein